MLGTFHVHYSHTLMLIQLKGAVARKRKRSISNEDALDKSSRAMYNNYYARNNNASALRPPNLGRVERFVIAVHHMASVCAAGPPGASVEEQVVSKHDACDCKCELVLHDR